MYILYKANVPKVTHRTPIEVSVFLHDYTIKKANVEIQKTLNEMVMLKYLSEEEELTLKISDAEKYSQHLKNKHFWKTLFQELPKRKIDNTILKGKHQVFDNLKLIVRSNERHTNQLIELIYE